jgi:DNA gyrase subunit A
MRMVIELKRGENAEVILNNLYQQTALQTVFGINMVALEDGQPRLLSLPQILKAFLSHRREVVTRRTLYELRKSRERAHILEGLAVALENIDAIIALIKAASDPAAARQALLERPWPARFVADLLRHAGPHSRLEGLPADVGLLEDRYVLTETQAQAILDLRLHRLTGLEQDKIHEEYQEILRRIEGLSEIVRSEVRLMEVIAEELAAIKAQYGDGRRTEILAGRLDLSREDLIAQETVVVTLSHAGYAKCQPLADYRAQRRGGKGRSFGRMREEDFVDRLVVANTHDTVLCFSNRGKAYWLKVYDLPQSGHGAQGRPIVNFLPLAEGEKLTAILPLAAFEEGKSVFMATSDGTVKKTPLADFSRPRTSGIAAIDLVDGNVLVGAGIANGNSDILLFSDAGKAVRFQETDVRSMGRNARGVRGLSLREGQRVVSLMIADPAAGDQVVLVASANGYGKRTLFSEFPRHNRGGQGVISMQVTERNGAIVGAVLAGDEDEVMMITDTGSLIRMCAREISLQSRNTQGVRLMGLDANERLVSVEKIEESAVLANGEVEAETQAMDAGDDDGADL